VVAVQWLIPELQYHVHVRGALHFQKTHDRYNHWVLFVAEEGGFAYRMDEGEERSAATGDMVLCPPDTTFHRRTDGLSFHMLGFQWQQPAETEATRALIGRHRLLNQPRLQSTLALLRDTLLYPAGEMLAYKEHLLRDLLLVSQAERRAPRMTPPHIDDPLLRQAIELMHEQSEQGGELRAIAERLGISQVQLTRLFRRQLGQPPSAYAAALRLDKVRRLLARTDLPLWRIAEQCGYTDEHHLSKSFKQRQGVNPSVYRRLHQV